MKQKEATKLFNTGASITLITQKGNIVGLTRIEVAKMFDVPVTQVKLSDVMRNGGYKLA
jgi:hypothetical protein